MAWLDGMVEILVSVEFTTGKGRERVRVLGTLEFTTLDDEVSQAHRDQDLDHTIKPRHWTRPKARTSIGWEHDSGTRKAARAGLPMLGRVV